VLAEGGDAEILARPFLPDMDPSQADDGVFDTFADISEGDAHFGTVEVGLSVETFRTLMREARSGGIGIALIEILLVALFSLMLGTFLTRQLQQLQHASERVAREGPGFRIPVKGKDELARTVRAFNEMSSRLAESDMNQQRALEESRDLAVRFRASEAQKTALLESALDAVITIDTDGRILEYNASAERIFGFEREEVRGRMLVELIIPHEHRERHRLGMASFRESGFGRILGKHLEMPALKKDGTEFLVELAIIHVASEHGGTFTAFMRDISQRKQTEDELRLAAHAFEAQEAIFITDADARILRVNRAFTGITGYAADDAIGQTPRILNSGRQDIGFYREMWARLLEDGHWEGEIENRRKDGEIFPEWLSITAVRDPEGKTSNYVAHFIDISDQKRNQAALDEARVRAEQGSEAKSRFLATMSHEIRTPLNAIINMNDLLLDTDLDSDQSTYAETASEAGRNLLSIVNSILDFSKIEAGRVEKNLEPSDPEKIAESVLRLFAPRAFAKGIELTLFVDPNTPRSFSTDPGLLRQILLNLVGNAVKFTERGGVRVRLHFEAKAPDGPQTSFDVIDTGIGIPADEQDALFTEFTQVDGSHTRRFGGSGLGLAISRSLARILGGDVGCESKPGRGSRFWLRLPSSDMEPAGSQASELARLCGDRSVLCQSRNPILAEEIKVQFKAVGLNARVVDELPGAPDWLDDPRCAGGIALVEDGVTEAVDDSAVHGSARLIRLVRTGQPGDGAAGVLGPLETGRVPLAPSALYGLLREAAGEPAEVPERAFRSKGQSQEPTAADRAMPILLVEDSAPNRLVATAILKNAGYRIETAENGLLAVAAVKKRFYGLVLMDIAMPEMDGFEAARTIRALEGEIGTVPIVAMTAGAFNEDRQRCLEAGMDDYLSKPVVRADLLRAVDQWLKAPESKAVH